MRVKGLIRCAGATTDNRDVRRVREDFIRPQLSNEY